MGASQPQSRWRQIVRYCSPGDDLPANPFPPRTRRSRDRRYGDACYFRTTEAGEEAFRHIRAGVTLAIRLAVVDALCLTRGVERVPV